MGARAGAVHTSTSQTAGVINLIQGDAAELSNQVLEHPDFSGLHFTGSSAVFRGLWGAVGERIGLSRPRPGAA